VRTIEGKKTLGRQRRRWVDKIKMDLGERERMGVVWFGLIRMRIGNVGELLLMR
jgi:hypothetical protein